MAASPLPAMRRVLVLAPHADDEVFGCGGTLYRLAQSGATITVIVVSDGVPDGSAGEGDTAPVIAEREAESRAAATILGYPSPAFWRLPDRGVRYCEALVERVLDATRKTDADLVFAPALSELHPDHQALALAAGEALRRLGGERHVAFYEVSAPLLPNVLIDITAAEEPKRAAMLCFRSQLGRQPYDEHIAALNRYRSYTLGNGVRAAEAFLMASAADLATGLGPLFESMLGRRRRIGVAIDAADVPLVSVIVRSMDRPTLAGALTSLAAQTYPNIEVLVINARGGVHSPLPDLGDRLITRLVDAGASLERSRAANAGLDAARGQYVAFLDDDDTLDPDHLSELVATLRREGEGIVAYSGVRCVDRNDPEHRVMRVFGEPFEGRAKLFAGNFIPSHACLFPRRLLDTGARFDETLNVYEDWDFWLQLAQSARFLYVDRVSATYFTGGTSDVSPLSFDPEAVRRAARALFSKWKDRISPEELKALGDLYHRSKAELLGTRGEVTRLVNLVWATEARLKDAENQLAEAEARSVDARSGLQQTTELLADREQELAKTVAHIRELLASTSWRVTAPLRWCGVQTRRAARLWRTGSAAAERDGGWSKLARRALDVGRADGLSGVKALIGRWATLADSPRENAVQVRAPLADLAWAAVSDKPEILFVSHDASRTGAPIFLLSLIAYLGRRLDLSCIILLARGGELEPAFRALGHTVVLGSRERLDAVVLDALKQRNIRVAYVNTISNGALQERLKALGCPILCHVHELAFSIEHFFGGRNLKQVLGSTDLFLAASKEVRAYLEKLVPPDRVVLAYPFIDAEANRQAARAAAPHLNVAPGTVVVGACGTLGWRKGSDLFVQLARRVLAVTAKPVVFVWIGGPLAQGEYRSLLYDADIMGIAGHLRFPGHVESPLPYFAQFDIFVLPSREDPFPLVMLDAASLGKPIVCFEHAGGTPELVETDAGVVVPYLDVDAMAAAVARLVESPELRAKLGENARRKTRERHDVSVGAEHIARAVHQLLAKQAA
jgi:LmbE family N-acetylglucosaminyl deacetylase/glycosyltransferase involved in cell wall biosynthesis